MKKKVAVLGLGEHQLSGIKLLKKEFIVFGFDADPNALSKDYIDIFYNIDFQKKELIYKICKKNKIIKVLSFNAEASMKSILWINDKLENTKSINKYTILDKIKLRSYLKKNKFPTPKFLNLKTMHLAKKSNFPAVVKPSSGSGSKGVFYSKNISQFKKLFQKNAMHYNGKNILVEKYIPGSEYAVEGWVDKSGTFKIGAISKKKRSKLPLLFDESLIINLKSKKINLLINDFMKNFTKSLRLSNVPIHMEFKIFKNDLFLIDISLRGAGFSVYSKILPKIVKQNTDKIIIDMFFNKNYKINKPNEKKFFLKFFYKSNFFLLKKYGTKIKKLTTFEKIKNYNLINLKLDSNTRIGHILLCSSKISQLKDDIKKIELFLKK